MSVKKLKYPWASIDLTQAEGKYCLHVALTEEVCFEVTLEKSDLDYLKVQLESIYSHLRFVKKTRVEGVVGSGEQKV